MDFGSFTITKREILVSIAITFILIGIGFLISSTIKNGINESNEKYYKSLKIKNDEEMFKYAIKTNVGYTLAQGKVQAVDGVSIQDIEGKYYYIKKVKEEYTRHTRQVEHTRTIGNKTEIYYTTEEYWTWDYAGKEEFHVNNFVFLGMEFNYELIKFNNVTYKETKAGGYHVRYQYYVIPFEFEGTLFTYISNNNIKQNEFSINKTIDEILKEKENSTNAFIIFFWFLWVIIIGFIDFGYVYLENNYLEN